MFSRSLKGQSVVPGDVPEDDMLGRIWGGKTATQAFRTSGRRNYGCGWMPVPEFYEALQPGSAKLSNTLEKAAQRSKQAALGYLIFGQSQP